MPKTDPKHLKRQKHCIEVEVDLREKEGHTDGLVILLEKRRDAKHLTQRAMLEAFCQDAVDDVLGEMEKDGQRAELAAAEEVVNERREALGMEAYDFGAFDDTVTGEGMKVILEVEDREGDRSAELQVEVDGEAFGGGRVCDFDALGVPEDANLNRDLSFFLDIPVWLARAHAEGAAGKSFHLVGASAAKAMEAAKREK